VRSRSHPLRLFVAIYPPPLVAERLLSHAAAALISVPSHRIVAADHIHLTLAFIGETTARDLRSVTESVERACAGIAPFALTPLRLCTVPLPPDDAPARLLAAFTDAPSPVMELHKRLAARLTKDKRKSNRFAPHLTLRRFPQHATPGESRAGRIDVPIDETPFIVSEVALVASVLSHQGARHERVHTIALGD